MAKAIWAVSNQEANLISLADLQKQIEFEKAELLRKGSAGRDFFEWMTFASDIGIRFPTEFILMNRGTAMLSQQLKNYRVKRTEKGLMKELVLENPTRLKDAFGSLPIGLLDWMRAGHSAYLNQTNREKTSLERLPLPRRSAPMCRDLFMPAAAH
jgi:hypothetical protein